MLGALTLAHAVGCWTIAAPGYSIRTDTPAWLVANNGTATVTHLASAQFRLWVNLVLTTAFAYTVTDVKVVVKLDGKAEITMAGS